MRGLLGKAHGAVLAWWAALRRQGRRELAILALPWICVAVGSVLAIASLLPNIAFVGTVRLSGQVGPRQVNETLFPYTGYNFADVAFEERPSCGLRLYALNLVQADAYLTSSTLPGPEGSLHCDRMRAGVEGQVVLFVITNSFNRTEQYSYRVDLLSLSQPYAVLALPGVLLLAPGALVIAFRRLQSGVTKLVEEYGTRKR